MNFQTIGVVGLGTIGQRWAAAFLHAGYNVNCYDPDASREKALQDALPDLMRELNELMPKEAIKGQITFSTNMAKALNCVDFVQENGPENLELKRKLLCEIEGNIHDSVVIASSSSALLVSDMQSECRFPGRVVLGHPFNPVHLMPLVEIVSGKETTEETLETAKNLYNEMGKKPVVLHKEITGHLALRLMGAMWREAIALVRDGVASAEDIDKAFVYGPGPKWTLQGSFISNQLNAHDMEDFLKKYGATYQAIWDSLLDAELDENTVRKVIESTSKAVGERTQDELKSEREVGLIAVLKSIANHGAL